MPHYKDGTPAKHGDLVIKKDSFQGASLEVCGVLVQIIPGCDTCNGNVVALAVRQRDTDGPWTLVQGGNALWSVTLKECTRIGE